jgi:microcystin-dependent protein
MAITSALSNAGQVPVGSVMPFAGSTAPANWLLCYGQAVSRTQYAGLFLTLGTTYGSGDGSTTFNLPDLRGRSISGVDNMGGSTANRVTAATSGITGTTLGAVGGTENLTAHTHSNTLSDPGHQHILWNASSLTMGSPEAGAGNYVRSIFTRSGYDNYATQWYAAPTSTGVTINNASAGAGGSQNMPPTIMLNYIVRAV